MFARFGKSGLFLLAGTLVLAGCETSSDLFGTDGDKGGKLTVQLTDAPGSLKEAWVKVDRIVLVRSEGGEGKDSGQVVLTPKVSKYYDLLTLAGGKVADLATETIQPGTYSQMRLVVCNMYIRTNDGAYIATPGASLPEGVKAESGAQLHLTSQCQSGFKVNFAEGGVKVDEGANTVVVDFDVSRSFAHPAGKSGKWIVKPTLHGVKKEAAAGIRGTVALQNVTLPVTCGGESLGQSALLAKFVPTATRDTTVRTGTTSGQGEFKISHVAPGTYALGAQKIGFANGDSLTFTAAASPASVTVGAGSTATSAYRVTAAACKPKA